MTLPELDPQTIGNIQMGLAAAGAGLVLFSKQIWAKVGPVLSKWWNKAPAPDDTPGSDPLEKYSIHDILHVLLDDRKKFDDKDGISILVAFGKHIYEYETEEALNGNK